MHYLAAGQAVWHRFPKWFQSGAVFAPLFVNDNNSESRHVIVTFFPCGPLDQSLVIPRPLKLEGGIFIFDQIRVSVNRGDRGGHPVKTLTHLTNHVNSRDLREF